MAEDDAKASESKPQTSDPANSSSAASSASSSSSASPHGGSPFGTPRPLHREPQTITGQIIASEVLGSSDAKAESTSDATSSVAHDTSKHDTSKHDTSAPPQDNPQESGDRDMSRDEAELIAKAPPPSATPSFLGLSPVAIATVIGIGFVSGLLGSLLGRVLLDDSRETFSAIDQRLIAMDGKLASEQAGIAAHGDALGLLDKKLSGVAASANDAATTAKGALSTAKQAQASARTGAPAASADVSGLETKLDTLEQKIAQIDGVLSQPKSAARAPQEPEAKQEAQDSKAPALAIIAETLVQKVSHGAPFQDELSALENLGLDKQKTDDLKPFAAKGIVAKDALSKQLTALTPALYKADETAEEGPIYERWMHHAARLVRIQKVGDETGTDLPSRITRVQDALAHDDLERALKEYAAFPAPVKAASADWGKTLETSAKAVATAKAVSAETLSRLTRLKS